MAETKPTVERTGNLFSFASCEFLIRYPDGSEERVWSPPWHEMTGEEEWDEAERIAAQKWARKHAAPGGKSNG